MIVRSRFLCPGKRPSPLLRFQLLSRSVNRVISHDPRCTHDIRSSSTWGSGPSSPLPAPLPPRFLFHLHGSLLPTRPSGMALLIPSLFFRDFFNALRKYWGRSNSIVVGWSESFSAGIKRLRESFATANVLFCFRAWWRFNLLSPGAMNNHFIQQFFKILISKLKYAARASNACYKYHSIFHEKFVSVSR